MSTIIDNGGAGYSETGTWTGASGGLNNNLRFVQCVSGTATATASWNFTGLTAGVAVTLGLTWVQTSNRATDVPWSVLDSDGTTILGSGTFNQQIAPSGVTDSAVNWTLFGTSFTPTGTSLTIKVTNHSADASKFVIADGARLAPLPLTSGTLSIASTSPSAVNLSWTAATGGAGFGTTPYQVRRAPDSSGVAGTYANLGSAQSGTTYSDTTGTAGTRYWYQVVTTDTAVATVTTNAVWAIPSTAPTGSVGWLLNASTVASSTLATGFPASNLYDSDFTTLFASNAGTNGWAGIDLGAGNAGTPSKVWFSPQTDGGNEKRAVSMPFEYADTIGGSWTTAATTPSYYPFRFVLNPFAVAPGVAKRCWRLRQPADVMALAELRFEGDWASNQIAWRPARPVITPGAGRFAAGQSVSVACPTTNATLYYESGYLAISGAWAGSTAYIRSATVSNGGEVYKCATSGTSAGSGGPTGTGSGIADGGCTWDYVGAAVATPTTSSAAYSAPLTTPAIPSGATWAIKVLAYHQGGVIASSDVVTAVFNAAEFGPNGGDNRYGTGATPQDWYDDRGVLLESHGGHWNFDTASSTWYWYGAYSSGSDSRGVYCYSGTDLYNWHFEGRVIDRSAAGQSDQTRPHVLDNPAPASGSNRYVMVIHDGQAAGGVLFAVATAPTGPFAYLYSGSPIQPTTAGPTAHSIGDVGIFRDPADGKWYLVASSDNQANITAWELDPATDYTSFTGVGVALESAGGHEAPELFAYAGRYWLISSGTLPYTGTGSTGLVSYKSATTLAGLAAATFASPWASPQNVMASVSQTTHAVQVRNYDGFILICDRWVPGESGADLYHARPVLWPIPPSAFSGGTLAIPSPDAWDKSFLPAIAAAPGIAPAEAVGTPSLSGSAAVAPGGVATAEAAGTPAASPGPGAVALPGIATGEAEGAPSLAPGPIDASPGGVASAEAEGTPSLAPGPIAAAPGGITSAEVAGSPTLSGPGTAIPPGIPTGESSGSPVLSPAPIDASPGGIPTAETPGIPTASGNTSGGAGSVALGGIASAEHVGSPTLSAPAPAFGLVGNWPRSIFPASIFPASIFPGPASPAPPEPDPPAVAGPDWMVLDDVVARLLATRAFEEAAWGANLELLFPESSYPAAAVEYVGTSENPVSDVDFLVKDGRYTLTIAARGEDMRGRSATLQALAATARNALSGVSLAGICQPYFCRLREDGPAAATPPESRLRLVGSYRYTIEDDDSRDDSLD